MPPLSIIFFFKLNMLVIRLSLKHEVSYSLFKEKASTANVI